MKRENSDTSIWKREYHLPGTARLKAAFARVPDTAAGWMAFLCISVYLLLPAAICVLAVVRCQIDVTYFYYHHIFEYYVYPYTSWVLAAAMVLRAFQLRRTGLRAASFFRQPVVMLFLYLTAWMTASTLVNGTNYTVRYGTASLGETFYTQLSYFVLLFPAALLIREDRLKTALLRLFMLVSLLLALSAFYLWPRQAESVFIMGWRPAFTCIFINTNYYGYFLTVAASLAAAMFCVERTKLWKAVSTLCLMANTAALSYNNTMGAWVGSFFACLFLVIAYRIRDGRFNRDAIISLTVFLAVMIGAGLYNGKLLRNISQLFDDIGYIVLQPGSQKALNAGSHRWRIWIEVLKQIKSHPLFGIGFVGVFHRELESIVRNNRPHNEYLQYALFYGIPAGIAYFGGCLSIFIHALRRKTDLNSLHVAALTAAFGYLVGGFFGLTLFNTTPYLFFMLGLGYVDMHGQIQKRSEQPCLTPLTSPGGASDD